MMTQSADHPFFCCVPSKYLVESKFEEKLANYEEKLIDETLKPFKPSGHAFVCLDSIGSVKACTKHFHISVWNYIKHSCYVVKETIVTCFGLFTAGSRDRAKSTLFKFSDITVDDDEELARIYKDAILVARPATEPADILWKNMRGSRGLFLLRRLALFITGLVLIIFVSSPAVVFANVKNADRTHFWDFEWLEDMPAGYMLHHHAAPTVILLINILLLIIIDYICIFESYETHSLYQEAVYSKSVIYLILNMLVIPALTLNGSYSDDISAQRKQLTEYSDSLWQFMSVRGWNVSRVLSEFYMGENGMFFVSLILQTAVYTSTFYLL